MKLLSSRIFQSQKIEGFCVANFATLSDERRSRSKIFPLFTWIKEPCVRKFEGLERSKLLGISQTIFKLNLSRFLPIGQLLSFLFICTIFTDSLATASCTGGKKHSNTSLLFNFKTRRKVGKWPLFKFPFENEVLATK